MEETSRDDVRRLLKAFGVKADELVIAHLARNRTSRPLHIVLILEDRTEYGGSPPAERLHLELEGDIRP
jgi:hypothetical protein